MSIATAPLRELTLAEWLDGPPAPEGYRDELVRGHRIMSPTEFVANSIAEGRLIAHLSRHLAHRWLAVPQPGLLIGGDPAATMRIPDLAVIPAQPSAGGRYVDAREVPLAVEVVSASSVETDWVTKRAEYAAAGIPNYLIVDVRGDAPQLWLFEQVLADGPSEPATYPPYPDPTGGGTSVTIHIPGCDPVTITAAELA